MRLARAPATRPLTQVRELLATVGRSESLMARALVIPAQLLMAFIIAFPAAVAIYVAFTGWSPITGAAWWQAYQFWIWLGNYGEVLSSVSFWLALWRTLLITTVSVSAELVLGFGLALLFVNPFRGRSFLTVLFLLPMMVVPAVTGFIFLMLFQTDGPINAALTGLLHRPIQVSWLENPSVAIWPIVVADIWQWTPLMFLIFLSGLVALPEEQLNAARLLGAGFWARLWRLVIPMMKPIILIALVIRAIETFKIFDAAWLLTRGGPGEATTTISILLYRQTFIDARWGYATAAAILVLILVSIVSLRAVRPIERAQGERLEKLLTADVERIEHALAVREIDDAIVTQAHAAGIREQAVDLDSQAAGLVRSLPQRRAEERATLDLIADLARRGGKWFVIALAGAVFWFPLYWIVTMAFKRPDEWTPVGTTLWTPKVATLDNFKNVLGLLPPSPFLTIGGAGATDASEPIRNSLGAATSGTLLALVVGVLAAYAIARFRAGGSLFPFQILQLRMFPPMAVVIPLMIMWSYLHLIDTLPGLALAYAAVTFPFVVWLMRGFFQDIPKEISDAALVDGCTEWGAFIKVMLPQAKGGLAATALFVFILNWSDFLIALVLSQQHVITAPVFLNSMQSVAAGQLFGPQAALGMILILPPAIFGLFIQRHLVRGLTFGAIKR